VNDRDQHRRGARAARPLTGRLDYIRALLENVQTHIDEAARDADATAHSRWVFAELGHLRGTVTEAVERARELRADMLAKGLSPHALGAPIPLVLKSQPPPLMPIEASLADDDQPRRLAHG
jgi:hypothetical protein